MIRAASTFSGIGGAELALPEAEWLWCAEIEPFPCALLAERFGASRPQIMPDPEAADSLKERRKRTASIKAVAGLPDTGSVANLGDITAPDFIDRAAALGRLDLLCGGPPCQAFSIAGLRKGMLDPRGLLSLRFIQVAHELADRVGLRNALVENVPGWLSHPENAFGCFLGGLVGADDALPNPAGGSWPRAGMVAGPRARAAWRVLDAQYAGMAQRRERVFLVADLGNGADPVSVLFERQGLLGNPPPRREAGEGVAATVTASTGGCSQKDAIDGRVVGIQPISGTLSGGAHPGSYNGQDAYNDMLVAHTLRAEGFDASEDGAGRGTPLVPELCATIPAGGNSTGGSRPPGMSAETAATMLIPMPIPVAYSIMPMNSGKDYKARETDIAQPIMAGGPVGGNQGGDYIAEQWAVRRLTVTECERLQGYPDNWTLIEHGSTRKLDEDEAAYLIAKGAHVWRDNKGALRTKAAADGPRYKALGNAWAVACVRPVAKLLAERIAA